MLGIRPVLRVISLPLHLLFTENNYGVTQEVAPKTKFLPLLANCSRLSMKNMNQKKNWCYNLFSQTVKRKSIFLRPHVARCEQAPVCSALAPLGACSQARTHAITRTRTSDVMYATLENLILTRPRLVCPRFPSRPRLGKNVITDDSPLVKPSMISG